MKAINNIEDMPEEYILTLIIPKDKQNIENGFRLIHAKEFCYNGNMFDVIWSSDLGDRTKFVCIFDFEETVLINNFVLHSDSDNLKYPPIKKTLKAYNFEQFILISENSDLKDQLSKLENNIFVLLNYISPSFSPGTPPPRIFQVC